MKTYRLPNVETSITELYNELQPTYKPHSTGIALGGIDITFDYLVSLMAPSKVRYSAQQYDSYKAMREDFERTGYLTINVNHSDRTIFGSPMGNWQFRAWHDMCHIQANADFSPAGERRAGKLMVEQLWKLDGPSLRDKARWAAIIDAEVSGQLAYYLIHDGRFPDDQRAFTLRYLEMEYGFKAGDFPQTLDNCTIAY